VTTRPTRLTPNICHCYLQILADAYKKEFPSGHFKILPYLSRPVVRFRPNKDTPLRTYTFVEAILAIRPLDESGLAMVDSDFAAAYKVAGKKFPESLQEQFLVLNDASPLVGAVESRRPGPSPGVRSEGRKRPDREDDEDDNMSSVSSKRSNRTAASVGN